MCVCVCGGVRAEAPRGRVPFRANGSNGRPGSSARQAERAAPRRQDPGAGAERRRAGREGGGCKSLSFLNSPPPALGSPLGSARRRLCPVDRPHHPLPGRRPPDTAFLPKRPTRARAEVGGRAGAHRGLREAAHGHDQPQQHVVAVRGQRQQPGDAGEGLGRRTPVHRRRLGPARPPQLEGPAAWPGTGARTPSTWGRAAPGRPGGARGGRWGRRGRRRAAASGTRGRRARGTGRSSRSPAGPGST